MDCDRIVRAGRFAAWLAGRVAGSARFSADAAGDRACSAASGTVAALRADRCAGRRHHPLLFCVPGRRIDSLPRILPRHAFDLAGLRVLLGDHQDHVLALFAYVEPVDRSWHVCGAVPGLADAPRPGCCDFLCDRAGGFQKCPELEPYRRARWPGNRRLGHWLGRAENV